MSFLSLLDINECDANPCDAETEECTNFIGNHTCTCLPGYGRNDQGKCQGDTAISLNQNWINIILTLYAIVIYLYNNYHYIDRYNF